MAAWYIGRNNEILLDIDKAFDTIQAGKTRLEMFFRRRLRDAERAGLLLVEKILLEPSYTEGNLHAFVKTAQPMTDLDRLIWQSWFGSDLYRSRTDLKRYSMKHAFPSLLIVPGPLKDWREPDAVCSCRRKHETVFLHDNPDQACMEWRRYRGPTPWECFGEPATGPDDGDSVDLPVGELVPLHKLRLI